jgi:hypothetical protein
MTWTFEGNTSLVEILLDLGFISTSTGLELDFGNGKLSAAKMWKLGGEVFSFYGFYKSERKMGQIEYELPLQVESYEQGIALLAYHLKSTDLAKKPNWIDTGLEWQDYLPWRKNVKEYDDNPKAIIEHDWFRLIVKKILTLSSDARDEETTSFSFDGTILRIDFTNNNLLVCPAKGTAWNSVAVLKTKSLNYLPKKIASKDIIIYVWEGSLHIGNRLFKLETFKEDVH